MANIKENCSLSSNGVIAELEQQIHNYEVSITNLKKTQRELIFKMQ